MIGMAAVITKPILPYVVVVGNPARILKLNEIGLERRGFEKSEIDLVKKHLTGILKGNKFSESFIIEKIVAFLDKNPAALIELR